jgi:hypothetical protein
MKLTNQIDKANPCSELAIIVLVGFLLTSRHVQMNQTVATLVRTPVKSDTLATLKYKRPLSPTVL